MKSYEYQYGFSEMHSDEMYNLETRKAKADKTIAVLEDALTEKREYLTFWDIGLTCPNG